ncbi:ECF RNA polymerase sigma factor SigK [Jatrophihabitans lederbergiae]|uniref:ECF RNA polymerase sigma factor SigK n=1 Tax=Jatrophihabitans lederbergiae TaxID=3075547 RepID=A0ABU2JG16_9ACTN|nr:ECF RNA polymerase sigma factor SigK [Jatrophihabitans sp. DSM 44399]MDT0263941.1 ECF RNA polymerase sigma factor SigK [Jatrophihabitans sp. DSM 44399]
MQSAAPSPDTSPEGPPALHPSPDLVELVHAAACGDENAFATFYALTSTRVYGMVLRVLRDTAQTSEVVQDIYLEVWQHSARFDVGKSGVLAWLLMIAHRRAVDRVRASQSALVRDDKYAALHTDRPYDCVTEHVLSSIEAQRVRSALGQLSTRHREAITLAYFSGHTQSEIAALLDIPLGTVKTRLRDGLGRLRELIPEPA